MKRRIARVVYTMTAFVLRWIPLALVAFGFFALIATIVYSIWTRAWAATAVFGLILAMLTVPFVNDWAEENRD